jgi:hypothetical protein
MVEIRRVNAHPNDEVASSFENAIELLYRDSWQEGLRRYRSHMAFRGLSDATGRLDTSLMRLAGTFASLERHLLRNFEKYAQLESADAIYSEWKWLTLGQHHGLPTRLLDWTYSPLVALHFVTVDGSNFSRDGVIWCVNYVECHKELPEPLHQELERVGADVFTVEMLEKTVHDLVDLDNLASEAFAIFVEPPSLDARIVNQFSLFSMLSSAVVAFDDWLVMRPQLYRRVVIPSATKSEIRDKLDQANITERVLYPGLDGLASWLKRHYNPKGDQGT